MRCPKCASVENKVVDSRLTKEGESIRRRRECLPCETRFTTYEEIERIEFRVLKRDKRYESFDRNKLQTSFLRACEKRPISLGHIEKCVEEVIQDLGTRQEIPTKVIGAKVMEKLRSLDPVAYVRYASVYRQFQEIGDFIEEIQSLKRKTVKTATQAELFEA